MSGLESLGTLTAEMIEKLIADLENGATLDETGRSVLGFLRDKKSILIGIAGSELAKVLVNMGDGSNVGLMDARRAYIDSLTYTQAVRAYHATVEELEKDVEPPMRLASIFESIAKFGAKLAPRLLALLGGVV